MWFNSLAGRHLTADVTATVARGLYDAGLTMYLTDLPALQAVGPEVDVGLRVPTQDIKAALFCNQPGATTPMHFDTVDTLTVQIRGSKRRGSRPTRQRQIRP